MKTIIFDFDGVIHNTFDLAYGLHKQFHPKSSKEIYRSYFEGNLFEKIDKKFDQQAHDKFRELEYEAFKELKLEREIRDELEKLSKNYDLYIISSNSIKNLNLYFENNNFTNIFKEILAAEAHKSKVEKFKMLFKKYNLDSNSCIFVTDTLGDVLEANNVGVKSIAVDFGFHEKERLEKGNPFKIVSNFKEIRKEIESM
ncbi:MAG: HAD-IA family hydrolase [Candidatus Woesearchaeota archaeon]|jgi:phosphoglycolate phosphatase|nr:HAD-IA family hydrolase [Candidatus Woesearchaeota archaeon]